MKQLTNQETKIITFIKEKQNEKGVPPSLISNSSVGLSIDFYKLTSILDDLEKKKIVTKEEKGKYKFYKVKK